MGLRDKVKKHVSRAVDKAENIISRSIEKKSMVMDNLVRSSTKPVSHVIRLVDELADALQPRAKFRLEVDAEADLRGDIGASIDWPTSTDINVNFKLPGFEESRPTAQASGDNSRDMTGGLYENVSGDREKLKLAERRLRLTGHLLKNGHRISSRDHLFVVARFIPEKISSILEDNALKNPLVFKITARESHAAPIIGFLGEDKFELNKLNDVWKYSEVGGPGTAAGATNFPIAHREMVLRKSYSPTELRLSLQTPQNAHLANDIEITIQRVSGSKDITGSLQIALMRQSAYLEDSLLFASFSHGVDIVDRFIGSGRTIIYRYSLDPIHARPDDIIKLSDGVRHNEIVKILSNAAAECNIPIMIPAPNPLAPPSLEGHSKVVAYNMAQAETIDRVIKLLNDIKEKLRDLTSSNDLDIRGALHGTVQSLSSTPKVSMSGLSVDLLSTVAGSIPELLKVSSFGDSDSITFFVPLAIGNDWKLRATAVGSQPANDAVGQEKDLVLLSLSYGWIDSIQKIAGACLGPTTNTTSVSWNCYDALV